MSRAQIDKLAKKLQKEFDLTKKKQIRRASTLQCTSHATETGAENDEETKDENQDLQQDLEVSDFGPMTTMPRQGHAKKAEEIRKEIEKNGVILPPLSKEDEVVFVFPLMAVNFNALLLKAVLVKMCQEEPTCAMLSMGKKERKKHFKEISHD